MPRRDRTRRYRRVHRPPQPDIAPARMHSIMWVRTWFFDYCLKPWKPK